MRDEEREKREEEEKERTKRGNDNDEDRRTGWLSSAPNSPQFIVRAQSPTTC